MGGNVAANQSHHKGSDFELIYVPGRPVTEFRSCQDKNKEGRQVGPEDEVRSNTEAVWGMATVQDHLQHHLATIKCHVKSWRFSASYHVDKLRDWEEEYLAVTHAFQCPPCTQLRLVHLTPVCRTAESFRRSHGRVQEQSGLYHRLHK